MQEEFIDRLQSASKVLQTADHMVYVTFPLIKDNRLLLKILSEIHSAILFIINAVLQYEYSYKRIMLNKDAKINFDIFREKCAPRFNLSQEEIIKIIEIFKIFEKHKQSPMEFSRKDKLVILSDNLKTEVITLEKLKEYLLVTKNILQKVNEKISVRA